MYLYSCDWFDTRNCSETPQSTDLNGHHADPWFPSNPVFEQRLRGVRDGVGTGSFGGSLSDTYRSWVRCVSRCFFSESDTATVHLPTPLLIV